MNLHLATNCVSLKNEPCMARTTLIDLNPLKFNHCPVMISLDKCSGSCNVADALSTKIFVPVKEKTKC